MQKEICRSLFGDKAAQASTWAEFQQHVRDYLSEDENQEKLVRLMLLNHYSEDLKKSRNGGDELLKLVHWILEHPNPKHYPKCWKTLEREASPKFAIGNTFIYSY
jgi:hypothetical protein